MAGETDLDTLLKGMTATLGEEVYVFATLPDRAIPAGLSPLMIYQEAEGTTLILTLAEAEQHGIQHDFRCRRITLNVHSALEAVGFIARIATTLAAAGMGVNPVAGYFHDHLFIPEDRARDAMAVLTEIAQRAARST